MLLIYQSYFIYLAFVGSECSKLDVGLKVPAVRKWRQALQMFLSLIWSWFHVFDTPMSCTCPGSWTGEGIFSMFICDDILISRFVGGGKEAAVILVIPFILKPELWIIM